MLLVGVLAQEGTRYLFVRAYRRTELIVKDTTPEANNIFPLNDVSSCLGMRLCEAVMRTEDVLWMLICVFASSFLDSCWLGLGIDAFPDDVRERDLCGQGPCLTFRGFVSISTVHRRSGIYE